MAGMTRFCFVLACRQREILHPRLLRCCFRLERPRQWRELTTNVLEEQPLFGDFGHLKFIAQAANVERRCQYICMYNLLYASRAQKVEIDTMDSKAGKSATCRCGGEGSKMTRMIDQRKSESTNYKPTI